MLCYEGTYNHHIWIIFLSPGHFLLHFVFLDVLVSVQHSLFYLVVRFQFSSVHFSLLVMFDFSRPHGPQHARPPCLSQTPEFTQTHVHWVGDAIQPSHPLSSPSSLARNLSQPQGLFQWVSSSHQVAKVLKFQLQRQSFQWYLRFRD